ncbi:putative Ig domain-containing protein [Staphylococcus epidermidis]|uniref:putative Ig domain-containing protein n=6 Tax=Staphylococcus epidermidis TaxID=1282 RepID=UPI002263EAB1|nr:putative Ig domain-containing protein [Staphylococcus epidermidis]MCH1572799.1 putative Ig domain-containing protein [Staphylococcus epidermidis]MDH9505931.1 putative Ig domain-containing protein [Staphylococcus epidermidis]MDH9510940.1 putative Ig domain-containing protein [Staphylococcus epidermidis]MDH9535957.1 putative Ig domain-containing protein [Staphylococcus epidermidis]MDH9542913.1 putative Ig domain-containing protein [Staphylococcus epidermidis]
MKNKQGFLPNLLNKYGIRKLSAGTASLLIGATLVFGINGQVKAAETDNTFSQNEDNKTNDSKSSDEELVKSEDDQISNTSADTTLESEFEQNNNPSSIEESTNRNDEDTLSQRTSTETETDTHVKSADNQTTNETTNKNDDNATTNHTESTSDESTYQSDDLNTTQHDNSNTNQDTQSTLNPTSKESSNKDEATSSTPKESTNIEKTSLSNDTNHQTTDEVNHSDSNNMTNSTPNDIENELDTTQLTSHDESPSPQSDNFTGFTNLMATPLNLRNDNSRINLLAATEDTKPKTYTKPNNSEYSYLLNDLGYDATTVKENSNLRHAGISQSQDNTGSVIKLNLTKWLSLQSNFVNGGKVNLSFAQSDFYTQIESITLSGVKMDTTNNGQNWSAPINGSTVNSGEIGSVTNHEILITLKNSQTLSSLGYSNNKPVYLTHTWTTNDGAIAEESIQVASITPTLDSKAPNTTQKSGFTAGRVINKIKYDSSQKSIKSVHTFKPNENFLQTDYRAVLYVKEQVNKELIPYIDPNSVKLYVSDPDGKPISQDRYVNGSIDNDGLFDSSKINEISIKNNNTSDQLSNARTSLDKNVFFGTLGQSRSYTISYKLKDGYTLESVASKVSARETFDSWMEVDYLDSYDSGAPNKRLFGSYASSYIDMIDRIAPVAPKANNITTEDTSIKGTAEADTNINLTFSDGRTLNGKVDTNGNFSITIPSDYVLTGKETIKITSIDKGDNVSPAITISVIDKTPPAVKAISNKTQEVNTAFNPFIIEATDNSGDKVMHDVRGLPAGVTFNNSSNMISGTPTDVGSYTVTVISRDVKGNETETSFKINVVDTTKPTVESVADQTQEVNTEIEPIKIEATDNSGQTVMNKVEGLPDGVTFDEATNTISGTPSEVGSYTVTVTTTDESGNATETTFTINVEDTTKPTVESVADQTQEVNTEITPIKIEARDNSGQAVTNKVEGLPDGVTFDETTNTISGTPSEVGSYTVTVTTTDESGNSETTTFTIDVKDTTKPTVEDIVDQTQEVNTEITPITIESEDNSGQAVTNKVEGLPDGVTFDETTNTISGTPSEVGSYTVTVTTTDESGNSETTTFTIDVEDTTKPTVESVADQKQEVNTEIEPIKIEATDNSGQGVTNKVDGLPAGVTFDEATNTISGTPSEVGSYDIKVTTTDESGNSETTTFTIDVEDTTKPTVEDIADQTQEVNTEITPIKIEATDNSGQTVTNKVDGLPDGVTFDEATNTISGTPSEVGSYDIKVTTTDESGNATETTFTIDVEDTSKPTVESVADQTQEVNTEITPIKIEARDNSGQAVTNKVDGLPAGVTFDEATNTISGTPSEVGSYDVTVTTTDESGNATEITFTINVEDTTKPTVEDIADQTQEVNTEITPIKIEATDNSGQGVTNKVEGLPDGVTFDETTNTISGTPNEVGSYTVTVTTTDESGNATETTFTIDVEDTTKPTVESIADQTQEINTEIEPIKIEATDNSGQAVTNKVDGLPAGVTFDETTNTISGTPSKVGSYDITVTTTDESGNSETTTFTINVEDTTKPTVESVADQTQEVNTEIEPIKIEAKDNSGQAVTNKVDGLPAGVTYDEVTNTISGTPSEVGSYTVTVTTTDESGNAIETTFTIDVKDTTKPTVEDIADQKQEVNTEIEPIKIEATDNSGQAVTNKVEGLPDGVTFDETTNTISGTPSETGSYTVTVTTTDESGNSETTTFTIDVEDTTKPTVESVADQTQEVNTEITPIKIEARDNSGQTVTNKVDGLPNGVTFDETTNTISGTPSEVGSYDIKVTTTDESGNETETTFTIDVEDTTKPTVKDIADQTQEVNTEIEPIKIEATDNSGQAVTNKVDGLPAGVTFDEATNTISGTPSEVGSYTVTVTTTDESGNATETTFTIDVEDTTKPTVESVADQTQEVNTEITPITIESEDNSGQAVTNKVDGLPDGVTFDEAANTISGTPSEVGSYDIKVTTTDESGNATETTFTIDVEDTSKPTVESVANQTQEVNTEITPIKIEATDNSGQTVTNKVEGLPDGVTFDEATNTISGTPNEVGSYDIKVTTTDESGNATETTFTINVEDTTKPTVEDIADQTQEVNTEITPITIESEDNSGQVVTNKVEGLPDGVTFDEATNTISGTPSEVGRYDITVTTTDESGNATETTFTIDVEDTTKPTVESVADQTQEVNTEIEPIKIEATDNSGQAVTNKVDGLPAGVTFDETTNTISGTPSEVGSYDITVTTTDESGNSETTTFTIDVKDTTKPTVESVADQTQEVNTEIEPIKIESEDNSGRAVMNKVEGLPDGVTFDEATNTISGTPSEVGSYDIKVTTTDESGNVTETTFTIDVEDTTKPTVEDIADQTQEVNTEIEPIKIEARDNSGQAVTNKVEGLPDGVTFDEATNTISGTPSEVGSYTVTVTTTDESGNSETTTFTIDVEDTTKPTVESVADQTQEVNTEIEPIKIEARDNSGQAVTNKVDGLPNGVTFDEATNTISGTPSEVGSYTVTVTTIDESGNATETTFTINVEDTTKPTVEDIADQTQEVNTEITPITIESEDNSGQAVTNKVDGLPAGVTFDEATNTINGTPSEVGSYDIKVTTTDESGNSETTIFTIDVKDTTKPTVESVADQTQEVNTEIESIKIEARDNSGQAVTNKVDGLPAGVTFDEATNTISGTPSEVGSYTVTVTTTDESGNSETTTFTIDVEDTTKPTVEDIADQTQEVNTEIDPIKIEATDNSGQAITNKVDGLPDGVTFDEVTNTISGTPSKVGSYTVTVTTTDESGNSETTTFTIDVEDTSKPTVESVADQTQEVNTEIEPIKIEATDNSGQAVTNKVDGLPDGVTFDETTNTISGTPSEVGSYDVTVTTTDESGNATETTFTINVEDTTKPTVESIANQTQEVNTEITPITIESENNSGQAVTNKVDGLPDGVTFDEATNTISGTPSEVGSYTVTVTTTDESGNSETTTFTIEVKDTTKPTVESVADQTQEVNTEIEPIKIEATDNSGQAVTNKVDGLPDGVTFDEATNTISGTPNEVGSYGITVTTTDESGNVTETTFTIDVKDTTKPTVESVADQTQEVNTEIEPIKIEAKDNSGQAVTNKVEGLPDGVTFDEATNTISGTPSEVGSYTVTVTTTDESGNSETTTFTIEVKDTTKPTVEDIADQTQEVNTEIEPIKIEAKDNSGQAVTNKVEGLPAGVTFDEATNTISGTPTEVGKYLITITTIDKDGNTATTTLTINIIDTTAPEQPTINKVTENSTEVSGRGEPGTIVEVTFPDGNKVEGKVDSDGNYHIQVPSETTLKGGQPLQVIAIDKAGNKSETTTTTVIDTTAPEQPTINKVTENSTEVSGRGEPGTIVEVTFPDGNKVEGKVDSDGNYHIQIPSDEKFKVGQQLIVKVVDEEGNVSEPSIATVHEEDKNSEKPGTVTDTVTKNNSKSLKHKASEQQSYHNKSEKIMSVNKPTKIVEKDMSTYDYSRYSKDISNKNNKSATFEQQNVSDINNNQYSRNKVNQPVKKSRTNEINKDLPQTGEENLNKSTLFGTLVASLGALLLFFKRRKKDEDGKE